MNCYLLLIRRCSQAIIKKVHNFKYSLTRLSITFCITLFTISFFIIASISTYYNNLLRTQYYNNTMDILRLYNNEQSSDLSTVETYLFQMGTYSIDASIINTTSDTLRYNTSKVKIFNTLTDNLVTFNKIDGLFFYSPTADDYIAATNKISTLSCSSYIKSFLRDNRDSIYHLNGVYTKWIPIQSNGRTYLIRFILSGNSIYGAWSSIETLTEDFSGVFSTDAIICYTDENMKIMDNKLFEDFSLESKLSLHQYQIYTQKETGSRYLVASEALSYSSCYIISFIPLSQINSFMIPIYQRLLIIILITIVIVLSIFYFYRRLIDVPFYALRNTLQAIETGDENTLISSVNLHCIEIVSLIEILNKMISEIRDLKINIYEEKLIKSKIELQHLRTQISPHFMINCLQTFSAIVTAPDPSGENRSIIRILMQTLSNHLRYSLSTRSTVTLKEEFSYVDNYLQLISIRYPECLNWKLDLSPDVQNTNVYPMILLMLTENSIKHNMIMGEKLQIIIQAFLEIRDELPYIHITHIDSGKGFSPELLIQCNHILEQPEVSNYGHSIGIYNIVKSLELSYHNKAEILFSNEQGKGARIDILIQYDMDANRKETK